MTRYVCVALLLLAVTVVAAGPGAAPARASCAAVVGGVLAEAVTA